MFDEMSLTKHYYRHLLSMLHKHQHSRRAIQQIHSHFLVLSFAEIGVLALWNSVLKHYSLGSFPQEAIFLFKYLRSQSTVMPYDSFTYSYLIKACGNLKQIRVGNQLRCLSSKVGFDYHVHVQTVLVNMYVDCGCLVEAWNLFDRMPEKNLVTWNVLITGFIKWGEIGFARAVFDAMPERNVISWTSLMDGYTRKHLFREALSLFQKMVVQEKIKPTEVTLLAIFPAIWNIGCLDSCQITHAYVEKSGFNVLDIRVMNSLIDAYAKSGSIKSAFKVFEDIDEAKKNLVSWTSILSGFAMHGMAEEAWNCFKRMQDEGINPNWITFLSVLNACSHSGLVDEGLKFYKEMVKESGIEPNIKHYGSLIDMLGRAGRLDEAEKMALDIPSEIGNVVIWRTLLGACSFHGDVERGERVTRKIMEMEREYGGDYVLLSNIFSAVGRFMDSERVRCVMDERNASKLPGITLI